ncbi:hypothetical protein M0Q50_02215 [bacterium]|jgi:hypothetical protein|nr:hypothetical protein [bacterium]
MKSFEQFDNIDNKEKHFLALAHLDELEIKFEFIKYKDMLFYFYDYGFLFDISKKSKIFNTSYLEICSVLEREYNMNIYDIRNFMTTMVDKYFKLKNYKILTSFPNRSFVITEEFND